MRYDTRALVEDCGWVAAVACLVGAVCVVLVVIGFNYHPHHATCPKGTTLGVVQYALVGKVLVPEYGCIIN